MCGVAAWIGGDDAALRVYEMLLGLQHRGQEAAGIAYLGNGNSIVVVKGCGTVTTAINLSNISSKTLLAIGHVRYSTSGSYGGTLAQPVTGPKKFVVVAFNGNIVNYYELGLEFFGREYGWDAHLLVDLIEQLYLDHGNLLDAIKEASKVLVGAYSLVAFTARGEFVAARDPKGVRPLAYHLSDKVVAIASETAALEEQGLYWKEMGNGMAIYCPTPNPRECYVDHLGWRGDPRPCVFEYIYFLRPDSFFEGVEAHRARVKMGFELAKIDDVEADIVAPVPDSGRSAAIGYSAGRGILLDEVIYLNRYVGRVFISPPSERNVKLSRKFGVVKSSVKGRRIVVVDDSIVRGITAKKITSLLRRAEARAVHYRSASPPVRYPCFFGIDFPSRRELVAYGRTVEEIKSVIGADTLLYNTVKALKKCVGRPTCMGCFTSEYAYQINLSKAEKLFSKRM